MRKFAKYLLALAVCFPLAEKAYSDIVLHTYQSGGKEICLSHEEGAVEFYIDGVPSQFGTAPVFLAPAPYPTPELTDDEQRTGIGVMFFPVSELSYEFRYDLRVNPRSGSCIEEDFDYGLNSQVKDEKTTSDEHKGSCFLRPSQLRLVPVDKSLLVNIICPISPRTGGCRVRYFMENGWEVKFAMNIENLPNWYDHIILAKKFFQENLNVCEVN